MADKLHTWFSRSTANLFCFALLMMAGCGESEQIRTYTIPKEPKVEVAATPATPPVGATAEAPPTTSGEPTDRMLTAVLPVDGQAWFFKVVGPIAVIEKHEKQLSDFFATIGVAADGKPTWKLPDGWKEGGERPMRFATLLMPTDEKPLEVAVSAASWPGTKESLVSNVNRWRGQLRLPPTDTEQVANDIREAKAGDKKITIVDLRGRFTGGMMPPFAGGAGQAAKAGPPGLPAGHPPVGAPSAEAPATQPASGTPKFDAPKDWVTIPADGIRKAAFAIGNAEKSALVTLISFPATEGPMIADPLTNVNRWRREVGLDELKRDDLTKVSEPIEIDGKASVYVRAVPDAAQASESKSSQATLAAMAKAGDQIWFIKLKGDRTVVTAQEGAFKTFLKSLQFSARDGAPDGNK